MAKKTRRLDPISIRELDRQSRRSQFNRFLSAIVIRDARLRERFENEVTRNVCRDLKLI